MALADVDDGGRVLPSCSTDTDEFCRALEGCARWPVPGAGLLRPISLVGKLPAMGEDAIAGELAADVLVLPLDYLSVHSATGSLDLPLPSSTVSHARNTSSLLRAIDHWSIPRTSTFSRAGSRPVDRVHGPLHRHTSNGFFKFTSLAGWR